MRRSRAITHSFSAVEIGRAIMGSDLVVVTAGAAQRPGDTRLELAAANVAMVTRLMPDLLRVAPDALYLVVSGNLGAYSLSAGGHRRLVGNPRDRRFVDRMPGN